jgi:antibiotic biosynthesis monooxygenase (ABM) superfamily enzyme
MRAAIIEQDGKVGRILYEKDNQESVNGCSSLKTWFGLEIEGSPETLARWNRTGARITLIYKIKIGFVSYFFGFRAVQ